MNVHFEEVVSGRGQVDYSTYLRELAKVGREVPLMLEHLRTAEEYDEGWLYIRKVGDRNGADFRLSCRFASGSALRTNCFLGRG